MNDLTNSTFRFKNTFSFENFNNKENNKNENDKNSSSDDDNTSTEVSGIGAAPSIGTQKERKILTNWLDAEYNSAFQYKKSKVLSSDCDTAKTNDNAEIDIEDPVVIYDYLKKYINILYDCDCEKDTEKLIVDTLESSLKEYFHSNSAEGIEKFLDKMFSELKNKYLIKIRVDEAPMIQIKKTDKKRFNFIQELENKYNSI